VTAEKLSRYFADFRRARGSGGFDFVVRDRERRGAIVAEGWVAGGKCDARIEAARCVAEIDAREKERVDA
jgi:hypothetical protein